MADDPDETGVLSQIPWQSGPLYIILSSSLIGVMGVSLISPLLPELRPVFDVSDAQVGLLITVYSAPGIIITPFIGYAADRLGRKRVLVPLLVTYGVAGAGIAFTTHFGVALGLRFLQGIGATALVMLSVTLIGDLYEGPRQDALIGINASMIGIGAAFFPLIGGVLAIVRWSVPFLFFSVSILVGVAGTVLLESTTPTETQFRNYVGRITAVVRLPQALALFAAMFFVFFIHFGAVITALPLLLSDEFGLTVAQIGLILPMVSLANATTSSLYGRFSTWLAAPKLISLGFVAFGLGLLVVWLAPHPVVIGAGLLVFGVGFGLTLPAIDRTIIALVSAELRAGVMGVRTSMLRFGQTIGPIGFTFTAERFFESTVVGYQLLILFVGIATIGGGSCFAVYFYVSSTAG
ncbi:MFS transporter [Salinadaptatus halalkaliphilus]|uniref:MFS transporter n=1 Tax=Salinadaptatus halalkaliphilus TaxID=2419781 RepID=A0A4V3VL03_9EURY|nr:MFS transporter [Salinadaptatus halalkaliphilus]THE63687.1 MFS transporter [Salinadaptatus halalkaliphilus]